MLNQQTIDLIKAAAELLCALAPDDDREAEAYIDEVCAALSPMTKRIRAKRNAEMTDERMYELDPDHFVCGTDEIPFYAMAMKLDRIQHALLNGCEGDFAFMAAASDGGHVAFETMDVDGTRLKVRLDDIIKLLEQGAEASKIQIKPFVDEYGYEHRWCWRSTDGGTCGGNGRNIMREGRDGFEAARERKNKNTVQSERIDNETMTAYWLREIQQQTASYYSGGNVNRIPIKPYVDEDGCTHRWLEVGGGGGASGGSGRHTQDTEDD